jgi:hypothetical protein
VTAAATRCSKEIDGPKYGRIVSWRKRCRVRTSDPSGRCRFHRGAASCYVGEPKWAHEAHIKQAQGD